MNRFFVQQFFDLSTYSLRALFDLEAPVWRSLFLLIPFMEARTLGKIETKIPEGCTLINPETISIGEGTVVESGVYIEGPCIIGKHSQIRSGARLRPYVLTGNHCTIGHCSEIKHSILLDRAAAPHFNYVGDSIIGNEVNLGAGVILANYRLDGEEVNIPFQGEEIATGLKKFGAIVGDGSKLGCNSVANPGSILPPNFRCHPCTNIKRTLKLKDLNSCQLYPN